MPAMLALDDVVSAAAKLGQHPQDHGWRELYRLLASGLAAGAPRLTLVLARGHQRRPTMSGTHLVMLFGIALKWIAPAAFARLISTEPLDSRMTLLESLIRRHRDEVDRIL